MFTCPTCKKVQPEGKNNGVSCRPCQDELHTFTVAIRWYAWKRMGKAHPYRFEQGNWRRRNCNDDSDGEGNGNNLGVHVFADPGANPRKGWKRT